MYTLRTHLHDLARFLTKDIFTFLLAFLSFLIIAIVFLHLYFALDTSPALIWPPVGLALALMIFGGYRMWLPIFLGQLSAMLLVSTSPLTTIFLVSIGYAVQAIVGLYILRQFNFEPDLGRLRNMLIFIGVALGVTCIAPLVSTIGQSFAGILRVDPLINLFRAWGGGVFSMLVVAPALLTWYPWKKEYLPNNTYQRWEIIAATVALILMNYFVFWLPLGQQVGIVIIFFLPALFIWFGLRLHPRWLVFAIAITAVQGVLGAIIANPSGNPLNEQLLNIQIYVALFAALFYVFAAVVEERRAAFLKLSETYLLTAASDKNKNEFIAILAHELRNPLAPVISSLELLAKKEDDEELKSTLKSTLQHTIMMRRLLDDLLDIARLEQHKIDLHKEDTVLRELVEQALPSVYEKADTLDHTITVQLSDDQTVLHVDPTRVKQIIINLMNNALKFTQPGGRIELRCMVVDHELVITVSDTGIGIEQERLTHLFEPFRQLGKASRYSSGLGIGLFLTKQLAELHGGKIDAYSPGIKQGSVFTVHIPLPHTHGSSKVSMSPTEKEKPAHTTSVPIRKILVVDDNKPAADILRKLLLLHAFDSVVAYSGKEAIATAQTYKPDVILLDIGMPEMDGYETARALRDTNWSGMIIALSGYGQESDKKRSKDAGFDEHLVKPVGIEEIVATFTRAQEQQQSKTS